MMKPLSRRSILTRAGVGGAASAGVVLAFVEDPAGASTDVTTTTTAAATTSCGTESTEQEEGPFYVTEGLVRSDITSGEDGIPLTLTITVLDPTTCRAAVGLAVDIWHANSAGEYSDESSEGTTGETYLRGLQVTNSAGQVHFTSVLPGWYSGRTIHIHDRVYAGGTVSGSGYSYADATLLYTGQFFFSDDIDTTIAATPPYSSNRTTRTTNSQDRVYTGQNGSDHVLAVTGSSSGYTASITLYIASDGSSVTDGDEDDSAITLLTSNPHVVAGQRLRLHGVLTDTTANKPINGAKVDITQTIDGKTRTAVVATDDDGAWTLTHGVKHTATYQATWTGDDNHLACSSAKKTIPVRYQVLVTHVTSIGPSTEPVHLAGALRPARRGIKVTLAHVDDNGAHKTIAHSHTNRRGQWHLTWSAPAGTHRLRVTVASDGHLHGGRSRIITVRRT